jgi:hypothetical protein
MEKNEQKAISPGKLSARQLKKTLLYVKPREKDDDDLSKPCESPAHVKGDELGGGEVGPTASTSKVILGRFRSRSPTKRNKSPSRSPRKSKAE